MACFKWDVGSWSDCSMLCNGGTKTRIVECLSGTSGNDRVVVADGYCTIYGEKAHVSDVCNTDVNCLWKCDNNHDYKFSRDECSCLDGGLPSLCCPDDDDDCQTLDQNMTSCDWTTKPDGLCGNTLERQVITGKYVPKPISYPEAFNSLRVAFGDIVFQIKTFPNEHEFEGRILEVCFSPSDCHELYTFANWFFELTVFKNNVYVKNLGSPLKVYRINVDTKAIEDNGIKALEVVELELPDILQNAVEKTGNMNLLRLSEEKLVAVVDNVFYTIETTDFSFVIKSVESSDTLPWLFAVGDLSGLALPTTKCDGKEQFMLSTFPAINVEGEDYKEISTSAHCVALNGVLSTTNPKSVHVDRANKIVWSYSEIKAQNSYEVTARQICSFDFALDGVETEIDGNCITMESMPGMLINSGTICRMNDFNGDSYLYCYTIDAGRECSESTNCFISSISTYMLNADDHSIEEVFSGNAIYGEENDIMHEYFKANSIEFNEISETEITVIDVYDGVYFNPLPQSYTPRYFFQEVNYEWFVVTDWSNCSKDCGIGTESREVGCRHKDTLDIVDDSVCGGFTAPTRKRECRNECILYKWSTEDWGLCIPTAGECGEGNRSRTVQCNKFTEFEGNVVEGTAEDSFCEASIAKPDTTADCMETCPEEPKYIYEWSVGDWGGCTVNGAKCRSPTDSQGLQYRLRKCYRTEIDFENIPDPSTKTLMDNEECELRATEDIAAEQSCFVPLCPVYIWKAVGSWSPCSADCIAEDKDTPYKVKTLVCVNQNDGCEDADCAVEDYKCIGKDKPNKSAYYKECDDINACVVHVEWISNAASIECPSIQDGQVECGKEEYYTIINTCQTLQGKTVDDSKCGELGVPDAYKVCPAFCEISYQWMYSGWTGCSSKDCSLGVQYRMKICIEEVANRRLRFLSVASVSDDKCLDAGFVPDGTTKPCYGLTGDACKNYEWTYEWNNGCSEPCGGGEMLPSKTTCMETIDGIEALDSKCNDDDKIVSKSCNNVECVSYHWEYSSWATCDKPCGVDSMKERRAYCYTNTGTRVASKKCTDIDVLKKSTCDNEDYYNGVPFTLTCAVNDVYYWDVTNWKACDKTCGGGTSSREVTCLKDSINVHGEVVTSVEDNTECTVARAGVKPIDTSSCNIKPCETYSWVIESKESCTVDCGGGTRRRNIICVNSKNGKVPTDMCGVNEKPDLEEKCNPQACNFCDYTTCNVANDATNYCERDLQKCVCSNFYSGRHCQDTVFCDGVQMTDGTCCASKLIDEEEKCCDVGSALDINGTCCTTGKLDSCGRCILDSSTHVYGQLIPGTSQCCNGEVDASLFCCESPNVVDECGVCGGTNSCASKAELKEEKTLDVSDCSEYVNNMVNTDSETYENEVEAASAAMGVDKENVSLNNPTCKAVTSTEGEGRRLTSSNTYNIGIEAIVVASSDDTLSASERADQIAENIAKNAPSIESDVSIGDLCGNGICTAPEVCLPGNEDSCCSADCPIVQTCEAPEFSGEECGGVLRGSCVAGICECTSSYIGDSCSECAVGYVMNEETYTCTKLVISFIVQETCADGILNNSEAAIDCGGPNCAACEISSISSSSGGDSSSGGFIVIILFIIFFGSIIGGGLYMLYLQKHKNTPSSSNSDNLNNHANDGFDYTIESDKKNDEGLAEIEIEMTAFVGNGNDETDADTNHHQNHHHHKQTQQQVEVEEPQDTNGITNDLIKGDVDVTINNSNDSIVAPSVSETENPANPALVLNINTTNQHTTAVI
eukprot:TRINITY_DN670_c0_g1_i11.p1 TRINITY_DN670_c0_g1~~TRINITY_DN670_c0_g1_i11.p1  ORF type:complete len:1939 (-),score=714.06 TRINITY_DN670_c0_g1_i11:574-5856(-)